MYPYGVVVVPVTDRGADAWKCWRMFAFMFHIIHQNGLAVKMGLPCCFLGTGNVYQGMELKSLGLKTELIFTSFDGLCIDRGRYLVVKTPSNPSYFWGNLLIFDRPPAKGDLQDWKRIFKEEFQDPRTYHLTFAWDSPEEGEMGQFAEDGFKLEKAIVLTARNVHLPPKNHPSLVVRPLVSDADWDGSIQVQMSETRGPLPKEQWEKFYRSQAMRYRQMAQAGKGAWFGGFLGEKMVAGLGIFTEGGIGRYQIVSTHADHRRQGICGSLVYQTAKHAYQEMGVETLVMVADEDYHAAKIYESVGFSPTERILGACWWDQSRV